MRQLKKFALSVCATAMLVACGGGDGNQTPTVQYTSVVNFGDSLSDAGTYRAGLIAAGIIGDSTKGGQFTINGIAGNPGDDPTPSYTWAQLVSAAAVGKPSCAARSGGFGVPPVAVSGCTNYAQGGSRVLDPKGVGNPVGTGFTAGPLTEPVTTQIANYFAALGSSTLTGKELFTMAAGANDLFAQTGKLQADATAAGGAAFVGALAGALSTGTATSAPVASRGAIAGAFVAAKTAGKSNALAVQAAIQAAAASGNTDVINLTYINGAVAAGQAAATTAGGNALAASLVSQLMAGLAPANQASAYTAISTAIGIEAVKPTATPTSIITAAVTAAATDAAVNAYTNINVANAATVGATAGAAANAAGNSAFVSSLAGTFAFDTAAPATAAPLIATAFVNAKTAGASDAIAVSAAAQAAGAAGNSKILNLTFIGTTVAAATATATTAGNTYAGTTGVANAVAGMQTAADDMATAVKGLVAKGAKYVVVVNIPDVSQTPQVLGAIVRNADGTVKDKSVQDIALAMVSAYNSELKANLAGTAGVLFVDAFTENQNQLKNPAQYGLTDVTHVACNLVFPANVFASNSGGLDDGSSLGCNKSNLVTGDTSHYLFADKVHPTPFGHKLLAQFVTKNMVTAGWL